MSSVEDRLKPFSELDRLSVQLDSPTLSVASDTFAALLTRLDTASDYIDIHVSYNQTIYLLRSLLLL